METPRPDGTSVLLTKESGFDLSKLASILASFYKTPAQDQMRFVKMCGGWIAHNLEPVRATTLRDQLTSQGFPSVVVPENKIIPLPDPIEVIKGEMTASGMRLMTSKQETIEIMPTEVICISSGVIQVTTSTKKMVKTGPSAGQQLLSAGILLTTGLPIKIGPAKKTVEKRVESSELYFVVDFFLKNPLRCVRIWGNHFDYSMLKELKTYQVLANVKALITRAMTMAPSAWTNRGIQIMLQNKPIREMNYENIDDFDHENHRLLTLQQLQ